MALVTLAVPAMARAQAEFVPARYAIGDPPIIPVAAVSGGEVFLETAIGVDGRVLRIRALRTTAPFTQAMIDAVGGWRFQPAHKAWPIASKVLIAGIFRAPALNSPTLGEQPKDVGSAAVDVAAPITSATPPYPPMAMGDGAVVIQVAVGVDGRVVSATIVQSSPGFDEAALTAARQWTFRPARIHGRLEETLAYLVFAFRQPITPPAVP